MTKEELLGKICYADAINECCSEDGDTSCEKCELEMSILLDKYAKQIRADVIDECKYNVELFKEIFLEELERQAVDREEIFMYRDICSMAWSKYLEQLKEQK